VGPSKIQCPIMSLRRDTSLRLRNFSRKLRADMTDAERHLWWRIRKHRVGGFRFRRQHPVAGYIVDFYCASARLAVEVDGGQHLDPEGLRRDEVRNRMLAGLGIRVLRFPSDVVLRDTDVVLESIYNALTASER